MKDLIKKLEEMSKKDVEASRGYPSDVVKGETWDKVIAIVAQHFIVNKDKDEDDDEPKYSGHMSFDNILERRLDKIRYTLSKKAEEYSSVDSQYHIFIVAGRMIDTTPEKALKGMMLKHEVSVLDMIDHPEQVTEKMIDEKIGDNINYLILLEGMLRERLSNG